MQRIMHKIVISMLLVGWAGAAEAKREIRISTVDQLYAAVYNEANANTRIVLAPGVYQLSAVGHPRGGALLLQEGMEIAGGNVYADADGDGVWDAEFDGNPVIAGETRLDGSGLVGFSDGGAATDCIGNSWGGGEGGGAAIELRYGKVESPNVVVGVARGGGQGPIVATDLSAATGAVIAPTLYEDFVGPRGP